MSKKIFKVWSLLLTVMLLASLFVPAAPVQAAYGVQQFTGQTLPTASGKILQYGTDVTAYVVGTGVIYATDYATGTIYQSTNGAQTWTTTSGTLPASIIALAVAPDNSNVIAAATISTLYISTDAGSTWTSLALSGNWIASNIKAIAIAPARSGTLLGREYFAAVVDPTVGATATATKNGDVLIIGGNSASWASAGPATSGNITGSRDYVAVAVTPNYVGDRSVVAIGASLTANSGGDAATGVVVQVIKTTPTAQAITQTAYLKTSGANTATDFGGAGTSIVTGSIALPADFDATTSSGIRAYVGITTLTDATGNDVYRVDNDTAKALSAGGGGKRINSVSYAGTIASGTLFQGRYDLSEVQYSTHMTSGSPTRTSTKKFIPGLGTASTNTTI
ncbi:MAG: hypothetical protein Q7R57_03380, partial [Dehalococcoidales bacterium]|nr:hypothetical protein [Dehalococcoidales bacterium]